MIGLNYNESIRVAFKKNKILTVSSTKLYGAELQFGVEHQHGDKFESNLLAAFLLPL